MSAGASIFFLIHRLRVLEVALGERQDHLVRPAMMISFWHRA